MATSTTCRVSASMRLRSLVPALRVTARLRSGVVCTVRGSTPTSVVTTLRSAVLMRVTVPRRALATKT